MCKAVFACVIFLIWLNCRTPASQTHHPHSHTHTHTHTLTFNFVPFPCTLHTPLPSPPPLLNPSLPPPRLFFLFPFLSSSSSSFLRLLFTFLRRFFSFLIIIYEQKKYSLLLRTAFSHTSTHIIITFIPTVNIPFLRQESATFASLYLSFDTFIECWHRL